MTPTKGLVSYRLRFVQMMPKITKNCGYDIILVYDLHLGNEFVRCPPLSNLSNGRIVYNSSRLDGGYSLDTRANFECHHGYYAYYSSGGWRSENCHYPESSWFEGTFQGYWRGNTPTCRQSNVIAGSFRVSLFI